MSEQAADTPRYKAFLSYSHKDAAAAGRLHRRLEAYRLPRRLVGRAAAHGPVPPRLWPIFRDREEMAAATDLSETVRAALAESAALIVLCSPDAAASRWVSEEIATFRRLYPERPVLAAILAGEPPACFPAALRAKAPDGSWHEPLATDLRRQGDGPQLGLLKLVAGITGVALDDLVQRDASRRVRRVTAVTAGALVALLIMAALTAFALGARREADRQRAEAEGLIEFMLTDLRDRLRAVGRLDALAAVNQRALAYYERIDPADLSDEAIGRRARILHAIGYDAVARHDSEAALAAFREAHEATAEQLARAPQDPRRIFEHANSDIGMGRVYEILEDWARAQQHYAASTAASERLLAVAPDNPEYLMSAAASANDIGNIQLNATRDYAAAQRTYQKAVKWLDQAARARPRDLHVQLARANAYGWLADSFFVRSLWRESLAHRLQQNVIVESLDRDHPANAEVKFRLAAAQRGLAYSFLRVGDSRSASDRFSRAQKTIRSLLRIEPANAEWRSLEALLSRDIARLTSARREQPAGRDGALSIAAAPEGRAQSNLAITLRRHAALDYPQTRITEGGDQS